MRGVFKSNGCCVRCLTSPKLIRLYSIVNLVVWGTVVVLSQGVLPVLHGCAGIIIALEGIFAAASRNESSIRIFIGIMTMNLVFCVVMGPLAVKNIYLECYGCANDRLDTNGSSRIYVGENVELCAPDIFCERAFGLYGWILIIFGAVLQLPIFLFTVGFYFAVSRNAPLKDQLTKHSLSPSDSTTRFEQNTEPNDVKQSKKVQDSNRNSRAMLDDSDNLQTFLSGKENLLNEKYDAHGHPASQFIFKPKEIMPSFISSQFPYQPSQHDKVWLLDPDAKYFNPDLSYL